ncbi:thiamine diphosphokinase [Haloimpatiens lingqiaonensis]|uniref:thiamine diphosphokinase n=1 Tax=Haloimpatiens lingqiaonensis TaxID=1380675 RepID=UPI0010FF36CF|nr:thiamine diphosphokinase [Haloimpatiens lingqiaonensis]
MNILIISGGTPPSRELLKKEVEKSDYIICADSGANCLYKNDICPDMLLGDFDSIKSETLEAFKKSNCKITTFPAEKDFTDSEMAIEEAINLGGDNLTFLGFTGTRIDHMLGNLGLLNKCLNKNVKAVMKDDNNEIYIYDKSFKIKGENKSIFSLQAYCDEVKNLTIQGGKYPLVNYNLKLGDSRTISNEFLNEEVSITFSSGKLLAILSKD